jgi:hypothetical protein
MIHSPKKLVLLQNLSAIASQLPEGDIQTLLDFAESLKIAKIGKRESQLGKGDRSVDKS